jgi:hypothetical protein
MHTLIYTYINTYIHTLMHTLIHTYIQVRETFDELGFKYYGGVNAPYTFVHFPGRDSWEVFEEILEKCQVCMYACMCVYVLCVCVCVLIMGSVGGDP